MAVCTFFGHRECPDSINPILIEKLEDLIRNHNVDQFYVGNQGKFDAVVRSVLRKLSTQYPHIRYTIVLAYMPGKSDHLEDYTNTMIPEGIESIPPRYAISWRNRWMLRQSNFVVTYIIHPWGGAAQYAQQAIRQHKTVWNLAEICSAQTSRNGEK